MEHYQHCTPKPVHTFATASGHAKLPTTSLRTLSYLSFSICRGIPGTFDCLTYMSVSVSDATYCKQKCNYSGNIVFRYSLQSQKKMHHM